MQNELNIRHIAIIPDGNGRWAIKKGKPRFYGHHQGAKTVLKCIKHLREYHIPYATFYIFSTENWSRPQSETGLLMQLFKSYAPAKAEELRQDNIAIYFFGRLTTLQKDTLETIEQVKRRNPLNPKLRVYFAMNYGGRSEILDACKKINEKIAKGELTSDEISERDFNNALYTPDCPNPDLVMRTAGEKRISNFLLWQSAYSEFIHADFLWPDYEKKHLDEAIRQFRLRKRKFGGIEQQQAQVNAEEINLKNSVKA